MKNIFIGLIMVAGAVGFAVLTSDTPNSFIGILVLGAGLLFGVLFINRGIFDISMRAGLLVRALWGIAITILVLAMAGNDLSAEKLGMAGIGVVVVFWALLDWRDLAKSDREIDAILNASPSIVPKLIDDGASLEVLCQALEQDGFDKKGAIGQVASYFQAERSEQDGLSAEVQAQLEALKVKSPWVYNRDPKYLLRSANFSQLLLHASSHAVIQTGDGPSVKGAIYLTPAHLVFVEMPESTITEKLGRMALGEALSRVTFGLSDIANDAKKMASDFVDNHPVGELLQGLTRENSFAVYLSDIQSLKDLEAKIGIVTNDKSFTFAISYPNNYTETERPNLWALERFLWTMKLPEAATLHGGNLSIA